MSKARKIQIQNTKRHDTFDTKTDDQLVQAYAKECGNPGWGSARVAYLSKLREAMLKRFDCSAIINESEDSTCPQQQSSCRMARS